TVHRHVQRLRADVHTDRARDHRYHDAGVSEGLSVAHGYPERKEVMTRVRVALLASCALAFASAQGAAGGGQNWDPPAVTVHPDHDRVAKDPALIPELIEQGRLLFKAKFNEADGAGRPAATGDSKPTPRDRRNDPGLHRTAGPDALSCFGCHNEPSIGGSGDFAANVFGGARFPDPLGDLGGLAPATASH